MPPVYRHPHTQFPQHATIFIVTTEDLFICISKCKQKSSDYYFPEAAHAHLFNTTGLGVQFGWEEGLKARYQYWVLQSKSYFSLSFEGNSTCTPSAEDFGESSGRRSVWFPLLITQPSTQHTLLRNYIQQERGVLLYHSACSRRWKNEILWAPCVLWSLLGW